MKMDNSQKILFELDKMDYEDKKYIHVAEHASVILDGFMLNKKIVSKIVVFKYKGQKKDSLFIELYAGHLGLGAKLYYEDVVIYIGSQENNGIKKIDSYSIRQAQDYDYSTNK